MFDLNKKDPARAAAESSPGQGLGSPSTSGSGYSASSRPASGRGMAVIGRSIQIIGDLRGDEDLCIEGDIDGSIHLPNHCLTIGAEGRIRADAYAKSVIIDGEINGDVHGSECVTLRAKAHVTGNILASRVSLEEGARFKGSIDMDPQSVNAALEKAQGLVGNGQSQRPAASGSNGSSAPSAAAAEAVAAESQPVKRAKAESTV